MAKKDTFEKMCDLYNAIIDIDRVINSAEVVNQNAECKLDQVLFYVKDIPKADYNPEYSDTIIQCIRSAIVEIYNNISEEINAEIAGVQPPMGCRQDHPFIKDLKSAQAVNYFGLKNVKNVERGIDDYGATGQTD